MKVRITFIEPMLGTLSGNPEIAKEFILSKHPQGLAADEVESLPDAEEETQNLSTVFPRDSEGLPFIWDYKVKGFFKDACSCLRRSDGDIGKYSRKLAAHKKTIDGVIFVTPRQIPIHANGPIAWLERPLRAQTPKGERIALARSEVVPAGSQIDFDVVALHTDLLPVIREWLDYGALRGMGQWRNASYGRFTYTISV